MLKRHISRAVRAFSVDNSSTHRSVELTRDKYNAIHLNLGPSLADNSVVTFIESILRQSKTDGTSSIWVHLSQPNLHLVGALCQAGLEIHYGKDHKISLNKWLIKDKANKVVPYSMFHLSCGGLFIKDDKVLLAEEKAGVLKGRYAIPGGRADHGQTVRECSQREVWEEIGMRSEFQGVLWMRELKGYLYDSSDVYYVCLMKALGSWDELKLCQDEIARVKWVPLKEYRQFSMANSMGTQRELASYISSLYQRNFDFANFRQQFSYGNQVSLIDGKTRHIGQHQFVH